MSTLRMILVRWVSAVLTLMPRSTEISFVFLPSAISCRTCRSRRVRRSRGKSVLASEAGATVVETLGLTYTPPRVTSRSEEHTSELQSLAYLVCRLLLEKKNRQIRNLTTENALSLTSEHALS